MTVNPNAKATMPVICKGVAPANAPRDTPLAARSAAPDSDTK